MLLDPTNRSLKYNLACAMSRLGEIDVALDYLESAFQQAQRQAITWAKSDTDLDPLRGNARFADIIAGAEARLARKPRAKAKRAT
jgi:adenylate cyclase